MVQLLATKLFVPSTRSELVSRPRLIERLNQSLRNTPGVILVSAPAGFGKTTLVSEWVHDLGSAIDDLRLDIAGEGQIESRKSKIINRVAWLSLDEGDNDPTRFVAYLVSALQNVAVNIGQSVLDILQSPQPPPIDSLLTTLVNEFASIPENFILILDDYHVIDAKPVEQALAFLVENLPPQMHLVIVSREDPPLPIARLRARGQLNELRAADLRFTSFEAAEFLNQVMGLNLSMEDIAVLESRTEGWIAGLQLAALSMRGEKGTAGFIQSFTGSHRFVLDYLVEEVLKRQPENIQAFLLCTSILDRMCGPLCDAVVETFQRLNVHTLSAQHSNVLRFKRSDDILDYLERANLFIIPLDNERRWYRYHHLFADLLRQRLQQGLSSSATNEKSLVNELHIRASQWFEDRGLQLEAFHHAAAASDVERAERLIEGNAIPRHFRGAVTTILDWLGSLPKEVLDARPVLWWRHASLLLVNGQTTGVAEKLQAAEDALQGARVDDKSRNLIGRIAAARATLALTRYDVDTMIAQSHRALEYLQPDNLSTRANAHWTLGTAYMFRGDRAAAGVALTEAISLSKAAGDIFTTILATLGLGNIQEVDNQLYLAAETYQGILQLASDRPLQIIGEVHLGMARVLYEWNDLDGAEQHGQQSLQLEQQYEKVIDRYIICEVFLARLKLARGDVLGAAAILAQSGQSARQNNFVFRLPEVAAAEILTLLRQGNLRTAADLAQTYNLSVSQARVHLARGNPSAALPVLETLRQQAEARDWKDEQLRMIVLQALAHYANSEKGEALQLLDDALKRAEPGGFIRLFLDEGAPMAELLSQAAAQQIMPEYTAKLLAAFEAEKQKMGDKLSQPTARPLIEPLSQRELEVLRLIAQGLSNNEIAKRLFLALDTVKGHNRRIYDKLQVQRRTEAVARARELGLL